MAINDVRRLGPELHHYLRPIGPDEAPVYRGRFVLTVDGREGRHPFPAAAGRVIDAAEIPPRSEVAKKTAEDAEQSLAGGHLGLSVSRLLSRCRRTLEE